MIYALCALCLVAGAVVEYFYAPAAKVVAVVKAVKASL